MEGDDVQQGISQRTIKKIFTLLEEKSLRHLSQEHSDRFDYTVKIGMLEIYNDEGKFYFASLAFFWLLQLNISLSSVRLARSGFCGC